MRISCNSNNSTLNVYTGSMYCIKWFHVKAIFTMVQYNVYTSLCHWWMRLRLCIQLFPYESAYTTLCALGTLRFMSWNCPRHQVQFQGIKHKVPLMKQEMKTCTRHCMSPFPVLFLLLSCHHSYIYDSCSSGGREDSNGGPSWSLPQQWVGECVLLWIWWSRWYCNLPPAGIPLPPAQYFRCPSTTK